MISSKITRFFSQTGIITCPRTNVGIQRTNFQGLLLHYTCMSRAIDSARDLGPLVLDLMTVVSRVQGRLAVRCVGQACTQGIASQAACKQNQYQAQKGPEQDQKT